ncbi:MAG: hypothetical protein V4737_08790 [Curtobacterium sp.]
MTEQQNTIQRARDVLKRVRDASTPHPWGTDVSYAEHPIGAFMSANVVVNDWDVASFGGADLAPGEGREDRARVLLTSDPDLLDAIDGLLRSYETLPERSTPTYLLRLAAAILSAEERMNA